MDAFEELSKVMDTNTRDFEKAREFESMLQNYRSPVVLSAAAALAERSARVKSIFVHFAILQTVLDRHEAKLHRRWLKKSKKQRRELVLGAWGTMPQSHRPELDFLGTFDRLHDDGLPKTFLQDKLDALEWPYINQEDLTKSRSLLLFLVSRGRNHPAAFATADLEAMHIGTSMRLLGAASLPGYTMMFSDRQNSESYGEPVPIITAPDQSERPQVDRGLGVGEGLLVLEAQERTMRFLCSCARDILHDLSTAEIFASPLLSTPDLPREKDTGVASFAVMAAKAPYRLPAQLDFDRIISLLTAKRDQAADHLWSLREDPGYFCDHAFEAYEHRSEMLKTERGLPNANLEAKYEIKHWTRILFDIVMIDYLHLEMFSELLSQAEALRQAYRSNAASIHSESDLPGLYMHLILRFRYLSLFAVYKDGKTANYDPTDAASMEMKLYGTTTMTDGLQHLIESEPRAKEMITPWIASVVGDLAIVSECLHQLEIYQPWARTFDTMLTEDRDRAIESDYLERTEATVICIRTALLSGRESLGRLGAPTKGFSYPIGKRMSEENVKQLRAAESKLDTFWDRVNTAILKALGPVKNTAIHRFLTQPRSMQRTPAWVPPQASKSASGSQVLSTPFAELELDRRHITEQTTLKDGSTRKVKTKTKTLGIATQLEPQVNVQDALAHDATDNRITFAVDDRSLEVFKTIFFTPSISATPGEIKLTDFLHAMVSVGFVPEKLYGSVWHFTPTRLEIEQSISFHEPHKEGKATGKIAYCLARRMGRRLTRKHGWDGSSFTLAEKKAER